MRIALISDIHGNLISFEAVLADIKREAVDQIIFLGDAISLGPQPQEVAAQLRALNCPGIMGNHDAILFNLDHLHQGGFADWYVEMTEWCVEQLSPVDFDYLRSFQPLLNIQLDPHDAEANLLCFHGSPKSDTNLILSTTPNADLDQMLAGHTAAVMACGHTHVQMIRRHKEAMIVNVGSVGVPFKRMPFEGRPPALPWAEYAIISWLSGTLSIDLRRVPIDLEGVRQTALDSNMPHVMSWSAAGLLTNLVA